MNTPEQMLGWANFTFRRFFEGVWQSQHSLWIDVRQGAETNREKMDYLVTVTWNPNHDMFEEDDSGQRWTTRTTGWTNAMEAAIEALASLERSNEEVSSTLHRGLPMNGPRAHVRIHAQYTRNRQSKDGGSDMIVYRTPCLMIQHYQFGESLAEHPVEETDESYIKDDIMCTWREPPPKKKPPLEESAAA